MFLFVNLRIYSDLDIHHQNMHCFFYHSKVLKEIAVGDLQPDETVDAMHESSLLRNLDHPGIVKFHDSFVDGGFFCIVTEFCEVRNGTCSLTVIYDYTKFVSVYTCVSIDVP